MAGAMEEAMRSGQDNMTPPGPVRLATVDDLDALVAMGERFFAASPYIGRMKLDLQALRDVLEGIVTGRSAIPATALVAHGEGRLQGVLVAIVTSPWFDPTRRVATELAWWVDTGPRSDARWYIAARLQRAFEAWARAQGTDGVVMGELLGTDTPEPSTLGRFFSRCGYQLAERAYFRSH